MAGFREFAAGQVWFYYNPNATKPLEQKKELGACTSRPVVVIQTAFYPEWNDVVTVCPMTSSDRRSGVYIDTTILKDGSIIEGGTVLPYLFYNIRTKYLYPCIATNNKRKLITLSEEDYAKVRHGFEYHFGIRSDPPDYVTNWKHLTDYDREMVIQDVKLAVNSWEETIGEHQKGGKVLSLKGQTNPILKQKPAQDPHVENHIMASLNVYDRDKQLLVSEDNDSSFNTARIEDPPPIHQEKDVKKRVTIKYAKMTVEEFSDYISWHSSGFYPTANPKTNIGEGSQVLAGVPLKDMCGKLTDYDKMQLVNMPISLIMSNTGIQSSSTASRFRKELRTNALGDRIRYDAENNIAIFTQNEIPPNFEYMGDLPINKARAKKAARRRKVLFSSSYEDLVSYYTMDSTDLAKATGLPLSYGNAFKQDIAKLHPAIADQFKEQVPLSSIQKEDSLVSLNMETLPYCMEEPTQSEDRVPYWMTLSHDEITEIKLTSKKHLNNIAHNYELSKEGARALRSSVISIGADKLKEEIPQTTTADIESTCRKIAEKESGSITFHDLLLFCQSDYATIAACLQQLKQGNTPSKADVRHTKTMLRKLIAKL